MLDPCRIAVTASAIVVAFLFFTRRLGPRGVQAERRLLAGFLFGMPLVYVARALLAGSEASLWVEIVGVPLFTALVLLGMKSSPWFLAAGIASHGIAWDAWLYENSAYIPDWYSVFCLLLDLALAGVPCFADFTP